MSGPVVPTGRTGWDWSPADVRATMSRTAGARLTRRRERHARSLLVGADLIAVPIGVFLGRAADPTAPATVLALTVVPARLLALAWRGAYDGVGVPVLGTPREVLTALGTSEADTVVVAGQGVLSRHALRRLAWQLEGTTARLYVASAVSDVAAPRIALQSLGGMTLLHVEAPRLSGAQLLLKPQWTGCARWPC